jgi:hypothetical protein
MLYREIIVAYFESNIKSINTLSGKMQSLSMVSKVVITATYRVKI